MDVPSEYIGREQAFVKHTILRTYLLRLFLIVGQKKEDVINYVDCFSGPWNANEENLSDTSIGVSLEQMEKGRLAIERGFNRVVKFRALFIEKSPEAYSRLTAFVSRNPYPSIEIKCILGDYTDHLDEVVSWCGHNFTFFFVDPTGWKNVIGAETMRPLLELDKSEFLINLMYDFINRAVSQDKHAKDMLEIFGEIPECSQGDPEVRQRKMLDLYRGNLKRIYGGRSAYVTVQKPGRNRVLYYLVYLTKASRGLEVFKSEAEKMEILQRNTQLKVRLRKQMQRAPISDMFEALDGGFDVVMEDSKNIIAAKEYLLEKLASGPLRICVDLWADILEETDLYPDDFQRAISELVKEELVVNHTANIARRRRKYIIDKNSEVWGLKEKE